MKHISDSDNIEQYFPNDEQIDPQLLSLLDFSKVDGTANFSLFCDFGNIQGYAQLCYSNVEKKIPCPNSKYLTTTFSNICEIGNGRMSLLNSSSYGEIEVNTKNLRCPKGPYLEDMNINLNNLAEALVKYVNSNPTICIDVENEHVDHFGSFPHDDSDNSDDDTDQRKLSSHISISKFNYLDFYHKSELQMLNPNNKIGDTIINSYLYYYSKYYKIVNPNTKVVISTECQTFNANQKGTSQSWTSESNWTKNYTKDELLTAKYFIYPIYQNVHWVWFVVDVENIKEVHIVCYDSLCTSEKITGSSWKRDCVTWIIDNINEIFAENTDEDKYISSNKHKCKNCTSYPQQPDSVNCGLYTLLGIKKFLEDKTTKFNSQSFGIKEILEFKATIRKLFKDELIKEYNERNLKEIKADGFLFDDIDEDL